MIENIDQELCKGCGNCMKICPVDTFRIDAVTHKANITYPEDCLTCFLCEIECPGKAISVHPFKQIMPAVIVYEKEGIDGKT